MILILPKSMTVLPVGPSASIVSTSLVATGTVFGAGELFRKPEGIADLPESYKDALAGVIGTFQAGF
jgi:hypothetical protein